MTGTDAANSAGGEASAALPTMFDVARLAGVSHMTVSRVVNDRPGVAEATRARVEAAIAQLRYHPSSSARIMAGSRSGALGLILAGRPDFGPSSAALGFTEAALEAGYTVSQVSMREVGETTLADAVRRLEQQRAEAIVLISGERAGVEMLRHLRPRVPVVAVASADEPGVHRVSLDQYAGAVLAVEHLVALGHREIRHIAGPDDSMDAAERRRAWADTLRAHGLEPRDPLVGDWTSASGAAAGRVLARDAAATAVFAGNDQMALGLLHAYRSAGVRVPEDVSVVGFDDVPEAAYFTPPLTTMRQDFDTLGRDVLATVLDGLRDESTSRSVPAERTRRVPVLVERDSTAVSAGR
ncbi:LacI family DNA-binding transcriptional regulator [Agromyces larvae]|uniref:LacI family DNA-binding transcriptional regulator n=1 Tax=Agromyces larvae TaxID=2929802 RepID=A0ABY4BY14_9MICO|nr:LacI family DNA-binding transcriptional regulator [Agromyces larvae]UOE44014.1 LacI family DNA-binding transcriptional regulator [Agromyces larvae]